MKKTKNITKTHSRIAWFALVALGLAPLSTQAAVVWDNGGGDLEWSTANNWDPDGVPVLNDDVTIGNGDTVNITGNVLPASGGVNLTLSGGSDLTYTGISGAFQFNLNGSSIALGAGSNLSYSGDMRMWTSSSLEFDDTASVGSTLDTEFRGSNAGLQFNLGATGFTTITPDVLKFWTGFDLSDVNFTVDFANYTGEANTFTLMDWSNAPAAATSQLLLDAASQSFLNASGYENIALTWDDTNNAIVLSFTEVVVVPEPSTLVLFGLGAAVLCICGRGRRKR